MVAGPAKARKKQEVARDVAPPMIIFFAAAQPAPATRCLLPGSFPSAQAQPHKNSMAACILVSSYFEVATVLVVLVVLVG